MLIHGNCSWGIRKILNHREISRTHISYKVGVNSQFSLWHDPWANNRHMLYYVGDQAISALESTSHAKLSTIIHNGEWYLGFSNDLTIT